MTFQTKLYVFTRNFVTTYTFLEPPPLPSENDQSLNTADQCEVESVVIQVSRVSVWCYLFIF